MNEGKSMLENISLHIQVTLWVGNKASFCNKGKRIMWNNENWTGKWRFEIKLPW